MTLGRGRNAFIDEKEAFYAWANTGDTEKAAKYLFDQGFKHPATQKAYSPGGIHRAATKFYVANPTEAYEYFRKVNPEFADEETGKAKFDAFILTKARQIFKLLSRSNVWYWANSTSTVENPDKTFLQRYPKTFSQWLQMPEDQLNEPPRQMIGREMYVYD